MLVATTDSLPGYAVHRVIGEVIGVTAHSENPYVEGFKALNGNSDYAGATKVLLRYREQAIAEMIRSARDHGANAIVGMRFDHREISGSLIEVCAYGTAVLAAPGAAMEAR